MRSHNEEHLIIVKSTDGYRYVVSEGSREGDSYLDQVGGRRVTIDHIRQVITGTEEYQGGEDEELLQVDSQLRTYLTTYYSEDSHHLVSRRPGGTISILISGKDQSKDNFRGGEWNSQWSYVQGKLEGRLNINTHFYEEGNIQLNCRKNLSLEVSDIKGIVSTI